jgi:hypothetical protein
MVGIRELSETKSLKNLTNQWVLPLVQKLRAGVGKVFGKMKAAENEAEDVS